MELVVELSDPSSGAGALRGSRSSRGFTGRPLFPGLEPLGFEALAALQAVPDTASGGARNSGNTLTLLVVGAIKEARYPSGRGEEGC
jgi:hypothetical protein